MRSVSNFKDLEQFGIIALTGEADNLSFRILCDLTPHGRMIVAETFGLKEDGFRSNWNSGAVASVMLSQYMISDIAVIAGVLERRIVIRTDTDMVFILEDGDTLTPPVYDREFNVVEPYKIALAGTRRSIPWPSHCGRIIRVFQPSRVGLTGSTADARLSTRNMHAMSGRVD